MRVQRNCSEKRFDCPKQTLLTAFLAHSTALHLVTLVVLVQTHGVMERAFDSRTSCVVPRRCCTEK